MVVVMVPLLALLSFLSVQWSVMSFDCADTALA